MYQDQAGLQGPPRDNPSNKVNVSAQKFEIHVSMGKWQGHTHLLGLSMAFGNKSC
jgi:hypothetical protein